MMPRSGFVLIAALWLIVALSAVALDSALRSQPARLAAANRLDETRAREAALAGVELVRSRLTAATLNRAEQIRADVSRQEGSSGRRQSVRSLLSVDDVWRDPQGLVPPGMSLGDAEFSVTVRGTGERLNINEADEEMIRAFLSQGLRNDYAAADQLTQAILDWRDEDDLPRLNGGEREQYLEDGLPVLPPNRPFASVAELRHVRGMTDEVFAQVEPFLTVIGSGMININAAPEAVLFAVPGLTVAVVAALLPIRSGGRYLQDRIDLEELTGFDIPEGMRPSEFNRRVTFATNEVEIISEGSIAGNPVHTVVRAVAARSAEGAVVLWRRIE
ncbi:MAG: hypothetical protein WEF86_08700 [Gemmatimonadota bacterium]